VWFLRYASVETKRHIKILGTAPGKVNILFSYALTSKRIKPVTLKCINIFSRPDRVSMGSNGIAFVRPSVRPFHFIFRTDWNSTLYFCTCVGHDHVSQGIEDQVQKSRLGPQFETRSVGPRSCIEDSFLVDNTSLSYVWNASYRTGAGLTVERQRRHSVRVADVGAEHARPHDHVIELTFRTRFHHAGRPTERTTSHTRLYGHTLTKFAGQLTDLCVAKK